VLYLITNDISARFLSGQLAHLVQSGYDVSVGTRTSVPPAAFDDGVAVHELPFEREPSPVADVRALVETFRLIRSCVPHIVNASTPKAGLLGMIAARVLRVPRRVYVVRGLRFETMTGAKRHLFRWLERVATACATDVVYNSRSLLDVAERDGAVRRGRGVVLGAGSGNGIAVERFAELPDRTDARQRLDLDLGADTLVIGFVGRLTLDKGIVDLVTAFDDIAAATDRAVLLVVGDFEPGDPVPADTQRSIGDSDRVVRVPWVDDAAVIYPAMDVLAFPSYREGLPNVPLEAQLCAVPVVAYASTGTVDALADGVGGRLVPPGDVDGLRDNLLDLLRDAEAARSLGEAGRRWVTERFDRHVVWSHLERLYGMTP